MRDWLSETHSPTLELLRHFLLRFFDSDLVTSPGQTAAALIASSSMFLIWFPFFTGPLKDKYAYLSALAMPGPYRQALCADELWLIVMMMSAIGLLSAIEWQSLFPGPGDYRALGWLPVRARQLFGAKLLALLTVATAAVVVLSLLPCLGFPALSGGRWAFEASLGGRVAATGAALVAACYFTLFAFVAAQGILLNLLRPARFAGIAGTVQGLLAGGSLALLVLSFSIGPPFANAVLRPNLARWLPPVWFLGLCQALSGDPAPEMHTLAREALWGLAAAVILVLAAYTVSYRRHRALTLEGLSTVRTERPWRGVILDWLLRDPRQQAVVVFLAKGFAGNGPHRMILMGYGGFGLAVLLSGMVGMLNLVDPARLVAARFVYAHVTLVMFLLAGLRHLFSVPVELRANWQFRITEGEGRLPWLLAVDRFVLFLGVLALLAVPFPLEVRLLGWRAVSESVLFALFGLCCYEATFASWEKLPFTCSYLPGKQPMWMVALRLFGLLALVLPLVNAILLACLYNPILFMAVAIVLLAGFWRSRGTRRQAWREIRLQYDESPDPAIHGLNLMR
jgi:hypothetical protein